MTPSSPSTEQVNRMFSAAEHLLRKSKADQSTMVEVQFDDEAGIAKLDGCCYDSDSMVDALGFLIRAGYMEPVRE